MTTLNSRKVTVYSMAVKGVFGRNRKVKVGVFNLAEVAEGQEAPSVDEVKRLAAEALVKEKVKPGSSFKVTATEETRETHQTEDGLTYNTTSFMIFSGKEILPVAFVA